MLNSEFIGGQNYFHSEFKGDKIMLNSEFIEGLKHFKQWVHELTKCFSEFMGVQKYV